MGKFPTGIVATTVVRKSVDHRNGVGSEYPTGIGYINLLAIRRHGPAKGLNPHRDYVYHRIGRGVSTVVDSAALYTAFSRHQATHREAEIAFTQPTATAPCCAKRELRNRSTDRPVGGPFVVKTFH